MLVCATLSTLAHETAGAACTRHSLRPLLSREGGTNGKARADHVARTRMYDPQAAPHIHRRPGESQDPLPRMSVATRRWRPDPFRNKLRWLWVLAFARTTRGGPGANPGPCPLGTAASGHP